MKFRGNLIVAAAGLALATPVAAQQAAEPLAPGTHAPDFTLVGAMRDGVMTDSLRLTDFRGHTLVIAFFYRAKSSG
jgi:Spy/CpxP family protein refolding chaperone